MSDSDLSCTPPEVREAANAAVQNLLPVKSKGKYEAAYSKFLQWCKAKKIKTYSENCLLAYFQEFSSKKSLWSNYSMLKSCLNMHDNIDISKYCKLIAFLKRETAGNKPKKSKILEEEHIQKFLAEAPDFEFLSLKIALIMGISGACRREELCKMSIDDIEFKKDVVVADITATKNNVPRRFAITEAGWIALLLKYRELRPNNAIKRFFLTYRNGKCINSPIGLNTFGKMPSRIAEYLGLNSSSDFSGHCFRRSSATLLANHGGDLLSLKRHGGWKSSSVAESYVENSLHGKKIIANTLTQPSSSVTAVHQSELINVTQTVTLANQAAPSISFSNCTNCTVNVYNNSSCAN